MCSGPELGTLDEIELLPPLLAGSFVTGQLAWTNKPMRLGGGLLLPPLSEGRILRQHDDDPESLWLFFLEGGEDSSLVAVKVQHFEKIVKQVLSEDE